MLQDSGETVSSMVLLGNNLKGEDMAVLNLNFESIEIIICGVLGYVCNAKIIVTSLSSFNYD